MSTGENKIRPQDKWDKKAGVISKTYKIDRKTAEEYQVVCKRLGIAMGTQLTKMMKEFIEQANKKHSE